MRIIFRSLLTKAVMAMAIISLLQGGAVAPAYVFWSNMSSDAIGRVDNDGANQVNSLFSGFSNSFGVAAGNGYVYGVDIGGNRVGRAVTDGSSPNINWITGCSTPCGVAVDGIYVYWTNQYSIGRANLDGSGVDQNWISGLSWYNCGLAVDDNYIYWACFYNGSGTTIGRANLDGTGVNESWITGCSGPSDVAVDGSYVYWTNYQSSGTVGRANLDGSGVDQTWITGVGYPWGIDVDDTYVYFGLSNSMARANLDGSGLNTGWLSDFGTFRGVSCTPTSSPVDLVSFMANRLPDRVKVKWATGAELETAGFHVWRADGQDKEFFRVTDELIPAVGGPFEGVLYRWLDYTVTPGTQYWYKLEDVSYSGLSTWHGPVKAQGKKPEIPGK